MEAFDKFVTEQFGERCPDYEEGCHCCKLWMLRDQVEAIVVIAGAE